LYRCQERGLTDNDEGLTPDPNYVEDELKLLSFYSRSNMDAVWHHTIVQDPYELLRIRRKQKMYLSRYGRTGHPSLWDNEEVTELGAYIDELSELIQAEKKAPGPEDD
jgi:hypothetical protein